VILVLPPLPDRTFCRSLGTISFTEPSAKSGGQYASLAVDMAPPRKRRLSPKARRALVLLANNPFGVNEDLLVFGHGFSRGMTAGLIRAGLALRYRMPYRVGGRVTEVAHMRITEAGRREIDG
jgi:hypothetical protein